MIEPKGKKNTDNMFFAALCLRGPSARRRTRKPFPIRALTIAAGILLAILAPQGIVDGGAGPISIIAPASFTSTSTEHVFIIASAAEEVTDLKLTVNGGPSTEPLMSKDGVHHFRVQLALGLNVIDITGTMGSEEVNAESLGVFRTSKIGMRIRSPFPKYYFHSQSFEDPCTKCHFTEDAEATAQSPSANAACLKCHNPLVSERHVHGPIAVGTCAVCHSMTSEPNKYQLNQNSFDLCLLCHVKKAEALKTKQYTHGPLGAALCDICHEPHSSANSSQLRQPKGEICMVCHKTLETVFETKEFLHEPFEQRRCTVCHDPHYSDHAFLQKKEVDQVCRSCHDEAMVEHSHPVGIIPLEPLPFETRYGEEGELICVTCHNPHGADGENMLPAGSCEGCHPK
jgi:predicted CXXCH cytochrome family protein